MPVCGDSASSFLFFIRFSICILGISATATKDMPEAARSALLRDQLYVDIYNYIFNENYLKEVRPSGVNGADTTFVRFQIAVSQIIDLDEKKQILFISIWRRMGWYDPRLNWYKSGNKTMIAVNTLNVPNSQIWVPDIVLYNDVREKQRDLSDFFVIINSTGYIRFNTPVVYKASCKLDVAYFPYDTQNCTLRFGSWAYTGDKINLTQAYESADLSHFKPNNEFQLLEVPAYRREVNYECCTVPYIDITFAVLLKRKPLFYLFNLVCPCIAIVTIALFGFRLPPESGERISLGVTVMLSLSVFLQLVGEHTPTQSESVPLLSIYFASTITLSSLSTMGSIGVLILHFHSDRGQMMPNILQSIFLNWLARVVFLHEWTKEKMTTEQSSKLFGRVGPFTQDTATSDSFNHGAMDSTSNSTCAERSQRSNLPSNNSLPSFVTLGNVNISEMHRILNRLESCVTDFSRRAQNQEKHQFIAEQWKAAAVVLDRFLFWLFSVAAVTATILLLVIIPLTTGNG